jgi:hypothetical protein
MGDWRLTGATVIQDMKFLLLSELDSRPSFKAGVCTVLPLTVSRIRYSSVQEMICHPALAIRH